MYQTGDQAHGETKRALFWKPRTAANRYTLRGRARRLWNELRGPVTRLSPWIEVGIVLAKHVFPRRMA